MFIWYECGNDNSCSLNADTEVGEIYFGFLKKLNELEFDLTSKMGSKYSSLKNFNYINPSRLWCRYFHACRDHWSPNMVYKGSSRLLENMQKVTHKRMQVHVLQKQAEEEWLVEQAGIWWTLKEALCYSFSLVQASQKEKYFNLAAGSLESTEHSISTEYKVRE